VVLRSISQWFGPEYLTQMGIAPINPEKPYQYSAWVVYIIINAGPSSVPNQSQVNNAEGNNTALKAYYDRSKNQFVFTAYLKSSWGGSLGLNKYTDFMFWHCLPDYSGRHSSMTLGIPTYPLS
jgi:hypothetical protein